MPALSNMFSNGFPPAVSQALGQQISFCLLAYGEIKESTKYVMHATHPMPSCAGHTGEQISRVSQYLEVSTKM